MSNGGWAAIGAEAGSTGAVTVDGASSTLTTASDFYVGNLGSATLTISNGGTMSNVAGFLGNQSGSTGTATVDGAGSIWTSIDLNVGTIGSGTLTIRNGGAVSNGGWAAIGAEAGSTGAVTVDGASSTLTTASDFYVGNPRQRHADDPQQRRGEQWLRLYRPLFRRDRRGDSGRWRRLDLDQ